MNQIWFGWNLASVCDLVLVSILGFISLPILSIVLDAGHGLFRSFLVDRLIGDVKGVSR